MGVQREYAFETLLAATEAAMQHARDDGADHYVIELVTDFRDLQTLKVRGIPPHMVTFGVVDQAGLGLLEDLAKTPATDREQTLTVLRVAHPDGRVDPVLIGPSSS